MSSTLKVQPKSKIFVETGSAFDTTDIGKILVRLTDLGSHCLLTIRCFIYPQTRPGGHDSLPQKRVDAGAFSYRKKTSKVEPTSFQKRGTGTGGMLVRAQTSPTQANSPSKTPKVESFSAYCARANPPNTELRRYLLHLHRNLNCLIYL